MDRHLNGIALKDERDVVLARQRARSIAGALGFEHHDQIRIATAVSEIARNAFRYARDGAVSFSVNPDSRMFRISVVDHGSGIPHLDVVLGGSYRSTTGMGMGILGTRRLMDEFSIDSTPLGTAVEFAKALPIHCGRLDAVALQKVAAEVARLHPITPIDELQIQNREMLKTLNELSERKEELSQTNLELHKAEEISRLSALHWETTFNTLSDGLALSDENGLVLRTNATFLRLLDLRSFEIQGHPLATTFASRFGLSLEDFLALGGGVQTAELTFGHRWFRARHDVIHLDSDKSAGSILIITDITEHKKLQETLKLSQRMAATGQLAQIIAHEINNPLEAMTNLLYLASHDAGNSPDTQSYIHQASGELERISSITRQVLAYHRESVITSNNPAGDILEAVVAIFRSHIAVNGVRLFSRVDCNLEIFVRAGELRQVFSNLISNAIDAIGKEHGTLYIRCIQSRDHATSKAGVRFLFSDSGSGIPAAVLPRIFEAFYTTKDAGGSGIGLWLSDEVVRKHDGNIRIRTRTEGQYRGTLFDIFIPTRDKPAENPDKIANDQMSLARL